MNQQPQYVYVQQPTFSPGVAAVLSFLIPGLGQIYRGKILAGIFWLILVSIGYLMFVIPGVVLHFICILCAASKPR